MEVVLGIEFYSCIVYSLLTQPWSTRTSLTLALVGSLLFIRDEFFLNNRECQERRNTTKAL